MQGRTFAIGDIHGEYEALLCLLDRLPELHESDTLVFVGDYLDRGDRSKEVIEHIRRLPAETRARVIALRGNHEDAWLRVIDAGWPEFTLPPGNGCLATLRSFTGGPPPHERPAVRHDEVSLLLQGSFFPEEIIRWMRELPYYYEDEHAIYVHAGLHRKDGEFLHPADTENPSALLWCRAEHFFRDYRGKRVVFGHTSTEFLPPELSSYTPEDPTDLWAGPSTIGLDTGCGKGGFLTAVELPALKVYESR